MRDAIAAREHITNLLAALCLLAAVAYCVWPDFRAGWMESARARASLMGTP